MLNGATRTLGTLVVALLLVSGCANELASPMSPSCIATEPPKETGEFATHAQLAKVYPRKSQLGANYTGCQTIWLQKGNHVSIARLHLKSGTVIAMELPGQVCRYAAAKSLPGNSAECPGTAPEVFPSEPAGCISSGQNKGHSGAECVDDYESP
jgi:hypothetical protein